MKYVITVSCSREYEFEIESTELGWAELEALELFAEDIENNFHKIIDTEIHERED